MIMSAIFWKVEGKFDIEKLKTYLNLDTLFIQEEEETE